MRKKFHGYYTPTAAEFDAIWKDSLIVLDANVLLDLYVYSDSTSHEILDLLEGCSNRLWLPYQAAAEYHRNRSGTIAREARRYASISNDLQAVEKALAARKSHPFIEPALLDGFLAKAGEVRIALEEGAKKHDALISDDPIRDRLATILDGRVGDAVPGETIGRWHEEGRKRYERQVPPGYKDVNKPEPERYGDLVIWFEIIQKAVDMNRPVILVTRDSKEDWWSKLGNRILGPRPELRQEFFERTGQQAYLYSTDRFLDLAREKGKEISESAVEEVEDARKERAEESEAMDALAWRSRDPWRWSKLLEQEGILQRMSEDPLERLRKQQEFMDRLGEDPLERVRRQIGEDPLEKLRKQQEFMDRLGEDPLERIRRQIGEDPLEKLRKQREFLGGESRVSNRRSSGNPGTEDENTTDKDAATPGDDEPEDEDSSS